MPEVISALPELLQMARMSVQHRDWAMQAPLRTSDLKLAYFLIAAAIVLPLLYFTNTINHLGLKTGQVFGASVLSFLFALRLKI
ncbi:MAG: hypothetical protein ACI8ZN_000547 [Bacteroidia bacterium]